MNIEIGTEILPNDFRWNPAEPVTGTTKFYVRVAEGFARRGHNVRVVYDGDPCEVRGVSYVPRGLQATPAPDLTLDCNLQRAPEVVGGKRFQWTSLYGRFDTCVGEGYDRLFLVSDFVHSTLSHAVKCPVSVVELGCDMPVLENPDTASRGKLACYTSSPDRGGKLLDDIWPDIKAATGYDLIKSPYTGLVTEEEMRKLYCSSRFWVFPAIGTDSILAALEAQACGCLPFYVPHMALPQTCRYGFQTDLYAFKGSLVAAFNAFDNDVGTWLAGRTKALNHAPIPTWQDTADRILSFVDSK